MDLKNNVVSIYDGFPTQYGVIIKYFVKKIWGICVILKREPFDAEIGVKNSTSIRDGSPTKYRGPYEISREKFFWMLWRQN